MVPQVLMEHISGCVFMMETGNPYCFRILQEFYVYIGAFDDLTFDLSSIAGKSGIAYLQVDAAGSSTQDWMYG